MKYQTVHVSNRVDKAAKAAREGGRVTATISSAGKETIQLTADSAELQHAAHKTGIGGVMMLEDSGAGTKKLGMLKELQWHPVHKKLRHASFQEVRSDQVVNTSVPVVLVGEPKQVTAKEAQLLKGHESIEIHAQVTDLPDLIAVDVSGLRIGDVVTAGDVVLPKGVQVVQADAVVCSLSVPRAAIEAGEAAAEEASAVASAAEPEVIGKKAEADA